MLIKYLINHYLKSIILILILFSTAIFTFNQSTYAKKVNNKKVYICTTSKSIRYHRNKSCRGIRKCKNGAIVAITLPKAIKNGRTPCKLCHPRRK